MAAVVTKCSLVIATKANYRYYTGIRTMLLETKLVLGTCQNHVTDFQFEQLHCRVAFQNEED